MTDVENRSIMAPINSGISGSFPVGGMSGSDTNSPFSIFGSNLFKTLGENYAKLLQNNSNEVLVSYYRVSYYTVSYFRWKLRKKGY